METKTIVRVNNVDIVATSDEQLIPIRPICEALGVDANGQKQRIERDEILSSVACVIHATGRDGKQYEMYCIPYKFVFGWLFSIDTSRVNEEARPAVLRIDAVRFRKLLNRVLPEECQMKNATDCWYVGAAVTGVLSAMMPFLLPLTVYCVCRAKKGEKGGAR